MFSNLVHGCPASIRGRTRVQCASHPQLHPHTLLINEQLLCICLFCLLDGSASWPLVMHNLEVSCYAQAAAASVPWHRLPASVSAQVACSCRLQGRLQSSLADVRAASHLPGGSAPAAPTPEVSVFLRPRMSSLWLPGSLSATRACSGEAGCQWGRCWSAQSNDRWNVYPCACRINFSRTGMQRKDWLSLVAIHSDAWLMAVAFYNGARLNREGR